MSNRKKLPNRRAAENLTYYWQGNKMEAHLGFYDNGKLGEIFLSAGKAGTGLSVTMIEAAVATSLALQYGCPVDVLLAAMPHDERVVGTRVAGTPDGPVGQLLSQLERRPELVEVTP